MNIKENTSHSLSVWYTPEEVDRYTKHLADLGITDEEQVAAVLEFIHKAACIAIEEYRMMNNITPNNHEQDY